MNIFDYIQPAAFVVLGTVAVAFIGIFFGLLFKGIDRKLSAHMQGRIGPPIIQPFRDVRKLFVKENIIPNHAIPWLFNLAPVIGLVATITILVYLPLAGFDPIAHTFKDGGLFLFGDLILILYLLIIPSLAMVIGGFASGSPYAIVGAQREMTTMISYEFPLAIIIVSIAFRLFQQANPDITNVFSLTTIASYPIWNNIDSIAGFAGLCILLLVLVIVTPAELSKIPFDSPEAETEIAGGLLTEYSGRNLGMFYLMDAVKTFVMASLIVVLFFPYTIASIVGTETIASFVGTNTILQIGIYTLDILFFLLKVFLVVLISVTLIRVAVARLKIDQIVSTYWVYLTLFGLVGLILLMWDQTVAVIISNVAASLGF